ncbi:MAG: hypothetical protein ACOCV2_01215 [Persicimonas sp.]
MTNETKRSGDKRGVVREQTLPGMGPRLGIEQLHRRRRLRRRRFECEEAKAKLGLMRSQMTRYEWFAERLDASVSLAERVATLSRPPVRPGEWERALVALSASDEPEASVFLRQWEPPEDDPLLACFHRICVWRAR